MTLKTLKRVTVLFDHFDSKCFVSKIEKKIRTCIAPTETLVIETHTCPYLVLNGNNHKVHSHEKVGHREIRQKTGLNRVVVAPN